MEEQLRIEANRPMKTHELQFNMPPAEITYASESLRKIEYSDLCRKKANISSKVAGYILDELQSSLDYTKKLLESNKITNSSF